MQTITTDGAADRLRSADSAKASLTARSVKGGRRSSQTTRDQRRAAAHRRVLLAQRRHQAYLALADLNARRDGGRLDQVRDVIEDQIRAELDLIADQSSELLELEMATAGERV